MSIFDTGADSTFAGTPVADAPPVQAPINLDDPTPQDVPDGDKISFDSKPPVSPQVAQQRAEKAHYALGDKSPGVEILKGSIENGTEDNLRQQTAAEKAILNAKEKQKLVESIVIGGPPTPESLGQVKAVAGAPVTEDSNTLWEKSFGKAITDRVLTGLSGAADMIVELGGSGEAALSVDAANATKDLIANKEVAQRIAEDLEAELKGMGWGERATTWLGANVPFLPWYRVSETMKNAPLEDGIKGHGSTISERVLWLHSLPPEEFYRELKAAVDELKEKNPETALYLAQAAVSYSTASQNFDNVMSALDVADVAGVLGAGKVATKFFKGAGKVAAGAAAESSVSSAAKAGISLVKQGTKNFQEFAKAVEAGMVDDLTGRAAKAQGDKSKAFGPGALEGYFEEIGAQAVDEEVKRAKVRIASLNESVAKGIKLTQNDVKLLKTNETLVKAAERWKAKRSGEDSVKVAMHDAVKAVEGTTTDAAKVFTVTGDIPTAARIDVSKEVQKVVAGKDPLTERGGLFSKVPSLYDPEVYGANIGNWSRAAADELFNTMRVNGRKMLDALTEPAMVRRLTPEALNAAFNEAEASLRNRLARTSDAIFDVSHTMPDTNMANVASVTAHIGMPDKQLFTTKRQAEYWGKSQYRLPEFSVVQRGTGYAIEVTKHVDETKGARAFLITTENTTNKVNPILNFLRSATGNVSKFQTEQRLTALHGQNEIHRLVDEAAQPLKDLKDKTNLNRVLQFNRDEIVERFDKHGKPLDPDRGSWFESIGELEKNWRKITGEFPSKQEVAAYFSYRQLHDLDYVARNLTIFRDLARQGVENVNISHVAKDASGADMFNRVELIGKKVDDLPWDNGYDDGLLKLSPEGETTFLPKSRANKQRLKELLEEGYQIVQVANPTLRPLKRYTDRTVNFVLTKDAEFTRLKWDQLPHRNGPHLEYQDNFFVKQAKITRAETQDEFARTQVQHTYDGEQAVMAFSTRAEATKYTQAMETARKLLKEGKTAELKSFLEGNLPFTYRKFKGLFQAVQKDGERIPAALDINEPFHALESGERVSDIDKTLKDRYEGFVDNIRNPSNLMDLVDKKFAGMRDVETLWTVNETLHKLEPARLVDPMTTINGAMGNIMRSRLMADYKIQAMESFAQEFGDLLPIPKDQFMSNPGYYIHNMQLVQATGSNVDRIRQAKASRQAILNLLGTDTVVGLDTEHQLSKLADSIYSRLGQKAAQRFTDMELYKATDPFTYTRGIAFHSTMGLFNPVQWFLQMQTMAHIIGVAGPTHAVPGMASGALMWKLRFTENPLIIKDFARKASKFGVNPEWFQESYAALKRTGFHLVEGEHAWKNYVLDPKLFKSSFGKFLDKGTIFFREGERMTRFAAWNTAYREWKTANPSVALDTAAQQKILARANTLTVNMTRAGNAYWNSGILSVPTQFGSYAARMSEQFLSGQLTKVEKARALATYSLLYGIPAAGSAVVPWPWYEDVRTYLLDNNIDVDNPLIEALHTGIISTFMHHVMGLDHNVSQRAGPGALPLVSQIREDGLTLDTLMGASTSIFGGWVKDGSGLVGNIISNLATEDGWKATPQDALQFLSNASVVNNAAKFVYAINYGKWFSKNGTYIGDASTADAIASLIMGTTTKEISDTYLKQRYLKEMDAAKKNAVREITKEFGRAFAAKDRGDEDGYKAAMNNAHMHFVGADFRPDERAQVLKQALGSNKSMAQSISEDWVKKAPSDKIEGRIKQYQDSRN